MYVCIYIYIYVHTNTNNDQVLLATADMCGAAAQLKEWHVFKEISRFAWIYLTRIWRL